MFLNLLTPLLKVKIKNSSIKTTAVRWFSSNKESCHQKSILLKPDCKTAVITGGSDGIGFATAHQLLCHNARRVALVGRNTKAGAEAIDYLNCTFGKSKALFYKCDVKNNGEVQDTMMKIKAEFKQIDILVNCAGIWSDIQWQEAMQTNLGGVINFSLAANEHVEKGNGVVINLAGFPGLGVFPPSPLFSSFAASIIHFSRSIGHDANFKKIGVRFVVLCVGVTKTNLLNDLDKRMLTKEMGKNLGEFLKSACCQKPDACAKAVIELIQFGPSGSVWLVEGSRLFYYSVPDYRKHVNLVSQFV